MNIHDADDVICPGVVVIDDQPEVSIDDPSFLFESNEGFQEVTSRRTQKSKQRAALEEALKKSQELQAQAAAQAKRMDKEAKVEEYSLIVDVSYLCLIIDGCAYKLIESQVLQTPFR